MDANEFLRLTGDDIVLVASLLLIAAAFAVWRLSYVEKPEKIEPGLSDGAVLMVSDGIVRQVSAASMPLLGDCADVPITRVLKNFLGDGLDRALAAVSQLEATGEPLDMLVHSSSGRPYELIGMPSGAMLRIVLREAELLDKLADEVETRAETVREVEEERAFAQAAMESLIADGPIIAWHRTEDGVVNWSGGEIRTTGGAVSAEQAVDLIVARTRINRQPVVAGQPQKSRIEIVLSDAETVSLHVIEIVRPDGNRVGLATDAGNAAIAERTLTRFVQTMTETFAHLTVGLAIFDRNQTLALFNPALVQMWQVEPSWLARRPSLRDIIDELRTTRRLPELQDFHQWRSRLMSLFENTEAADYEELWHLADGSNIRVLARPHPHGSLAFIFDDVTERMRLEQRYRHSIDLRRATLDGLSEGIAVFGSNGLLEFVNQAFHEIWNTDGDTIYSAMHARQLINYCEELTLDPEIWHRLHSFITGEDNRRTWTARMQLQSQRVLTARFSPLPDGSTMAVFTDITDHERVAEGLRLRTEAQGIVEAGRAAIAARVEQTLRPAAEHLAKRASRSKKAEAEAGEMLALIDEISAVSGSRLATGGHGSIREVLEDCRSVLAARADAAGIVLEIVEDEALSRAVPVRIAFGHLLFNLASGLIAGIRKGGKIHLGAVVEDGQTGLRLAGTHEDEQVLGDNVESAMQVVNERATASAQRANTIVHVDTPNEQRLELTCWFGAQDSRLPGLPVIDLGQDLANSGNILRLPRNGDRA